MPSVLGRCETEATKLDIDAPKLSQKKRAPTIDEFGEYNFGGKAATEYANVISHYVEYILNP